MSTEPDNAAFATTGIFEQGEAGEYFAALAMHLAQDLEPTDAAEFAVRVADALIAALNKAPK